MIPIALPIFLAFMVGDKRVQNSPESKRRLQHFTFDHCRERFQMQMPPLRNGMPLPVRAEDYYYAPENVSRTTVSGIEAYRSALTLDWLAAEDTRQRELVAAYETEPSAPARIITTECINYPRPSSGRVGKLMLELLKNLEGDEGTLVPELIQVLMRTKLLVETSKLESEPDLEALVKTPMMMMGEPHITFPRILAIVWMLVTDTTTTKNNSWYPIHKVSKYLISTKPTDIAKHLRVLEPVVARARFIMEEFTQNVTPLNMYHKKTTVSKTRQTMPIESGEILAKLPRASRDEMEQPDELNQDDMASLETEYSSTPVLEQAQQIGNVLEETNVPAKDVATRMPAFSHVSIFLIYVLMTF